MIEVVQSKAAQDDTSVSSIGVTFDASTDTDNTLVLFVSAGSASTKVPVTPSGWTLRHLSSPQGHSFACWTRAGSGTALAVSVTFVDGGGAPANVDIATIMVAEVSGVYAGSAMNGDFTSGSTQPLAGVTPGPGIEALMLAGAVFNNAYTLNTVPSGYSTEENIVADIGYSHRATMHANYEASTTSGAYGGNLVYAGSATHYWSIQAYFTEIPPVGITITADPTSGDAILAVHFDTIPEGGTPSAYLWDFGDGVTSTDDNPIHAYTEPGIYDVLLTATILGDDYTDTITITVNFADYTPPSPGRAILEIKASDPGSARWDVAEWDEAVWSSASWQDVTPYGIEVFITWGSSRPEFGILSTPDACAWSITFYDPDRVLDPANADSPYFGDLEPLLPVRLRLSSGQIIKQGFVESMSHRFENDTGYWRVMDIQALLANAVVPSDSTLADSLFGRARDAIAAAGLSITVAPDPPGGDPDVVAWETGHEATAWQWILDAAQQTHYVPFVRENNTLDFRDYRTPLNRAREIGSPNLVDLQSIIMHNGLFSIVKAGVETRELTPKPRYGARTYERDGVIDGTTPVDDGVWAQTVLDDRSVAGLRWVPGTVVPFTAQEVKYFAELEAIEQVGIVYPEAVPPVISDGIIVGGEIRVRGKKDDDAIWDFLFHVAQIPTQPLVDDLDAESYLVRDDDPTEYLYPDA